MISSQDADADLQRINEILEREPTCPYYLVKRALAILLRQTDGPPTLKDAEADLLNAHNLAPTHLEALEELAHLYDAVIPDRNKARHYAQLCRAQASKLASDMEEIILEVEHR